MNKSQTQVLQWARRVRGFVAETPVKSDVAELTTLTQELDETLEQLTADAAAQEAITKQSRVQTTEIKRLRQTLRDKHLKPIVGMSRTMQLQINGSDITFVVPSVKTDSERLAAHSDAMATALNVVGPQFTARGFASNFVEQLSSTTKTLRDAIDQRAKQVSQRIGVTAAMLAHKNKVMQIVRAIDTIVRPSIQTTPELLAAWDNLVALPRLRKPAASAAPTPAGSTSTAGSTTPATPTTVGTTAGQVANVAA